MTITEYKLTSDKITGEIVFIYHDGFLFSLLFKVSAPISIEQFKWLVAHIYYREELLNNDGNRIGGIALQCLTPAANKAGQLSAMDKVLLFCEYYLKHIGIAYHRSAKDHLMIRTFEVTDKLLTTYFTSNNVVFKNHYSIANYTKFYAELRAEAAGALKKKSFPNEYDAEYERGLSVKEMPEYWKHLRANGWEPKKRGGQTIGWTRKSETQNS